MQISKSKQALVKVACAAVILTLAGCRSVTPKWSLFSFGKRPSPETLAGQGPTTTYPAPPSESSTPNAITSVAGGVTAPETPSFAIANNSTQPSFATAGSPTAGFPKTGTEANFAAAQANGYPFAATAGKPTAPTGPPGYTTPGAKPSDLTVPAIPTGYQFGTRATPPGASSVAAAGTGSTTKSPTIGSAGLAMPPLTTPKVPAAGSTTLPPPASSFAGLPTSNAPAPPATLSNNSGGGFALPAGLAEKVNATATKSYEVASNPKPFTPKLPPMASTPSVQLPPAPSSTTSTISTASATLAPTSQSPSVTTPGYAPGSTSGSTGYPAGGYPATGTSGSFYR